MSHVGGGRTRVMWECVGRPVRQPWRMCVGGQLESARNYLQNRWKFRWKWGMFSEQTQTCNESMSTQTLIFESKTPSMSNSDDVSLMAIDVPVPRKAEVCD